MRSPLVRVRELLSHYREARAMAELARARGSEEAEAQLRTSRAALGTGEAREALAEALALGLLDARGHAALLAELAHVAFDAVLARHGADRGLSSATEVALEGHVRGLGEVALEALTHPLRAARSRALEAVASAISRVEGRWSDALAEAHARASEIRARGGKVADDDPDELEADAERLLSGTGDLVLEAIERRARSARIEGQRAIESLASLRAPELDVLVPSRDRGRRMGALLAPLGLRPVLDEHARLEPPSSALGLETSVIARAARFDRARIIPPALELGLASELSLARATGRTLASLLVAPALPIEHRDAARGSVGHSIGELMAAALAEPALRARDLGAEAATSLARAAGLQNLARARWLAAMYLVHRGRGEASERIAAALGARDARLAAPLTRAWVGLDHGAILRAALRAPALVLSLRDRFDEDWYRNPRSAEPLRHASSRGLTLSVEAWDAEVTRDARPAIERALARWTELSLG